MKLARTSGMLALGLVNATSAQAQSSTHALAAEELFRDGRALIAEHRFKEACEKLAASEKIEPAVGTLVSLGECYSGQGRTASAWLAYRNAIALAAERDDPRKAAAEERAAAFEPILSSLVLHVSAQSPAQERQIAIDGEAFGDDVLGAPVPIDPGPHTIVASAPGYRTWSARLQVGAQGDRVTVDVPPLEPLPDPAAVERARSAAMTRRKVGFALGGAGIVGLGVGAILGFEALAKIHDANRQCATGATCSNASAVQENQTGKGFADASSVAVPVSAAVLVAGAVLLFTTHLPPRTEIGADVSPAGGRVRVSWSW